MLPFKVLSVYRPKIWKAHIIGRDLTNLTHDLGYRPHIDYSHGPLKLTGRNWCSELLHAEVRRRTFKTKQAEDWHFDSDLDPRGNPNCLIVCWASNNATQIKWRNAREGYPNTSLNDPEFELIYQPKPYEVVVFDNMKCLHRRPPNCPRVRYLFRQRVGYLEQK